MSTQTRNPEDRILTIPNLMSLFRLLLIPVFVYLYIVKQAMWQTAAVLALSGVTDVADGYVARTFHMTSKLGKALDPVADKLTQIAMLFCLVTRFPLMLLPLFLLIAKELAAGIMGLLILERTGEVHGAEWHGKLTTVLLYTTLILHVLWYDIPAALSNAMIVLCTAVMLLSLVLYVRRNVHILMKEYPS